MTLELGNDPRAMPLRLENPTTIVPGDRVANFLYDVCTG